MTVYEALMIAITSVIMIVHVIGLIVRVVRKKKK